MKTLNDVFDRVDESKNLQAEKEIFTSETIKEMISILIDNSAPLPYCISQNCANFKSVDGNRIANLLIFQENYKIEFRFQKSEDGLFIIEEKEITCNFNKGLKEEHLIELAEKLIGNA